VTISSFFNRHSAGLRWVPALCFAIAIFLFSATPGEEIGQSYHRLASALQTISATSTAKPATSAAQTFSPTFPAQPATPTAKTFSPTLPALPSYTKNDWLKTGHMIGYFFLGLTVFYALPAASRGSPSIALLLCSLYGIGDEFHQLFIPGRTASARDILIDTLAALGGVIVLLAAMAIRSSKRGAAG
jgi:VanZ family protein